MKSIIIEGSPVVITRLEKELKEELMALDLANDVSVNTRFINIDTEPGDLAFGEEIKQILLGVAGVLKAVPTAAEKVAGGIARRLSRNQLNATIRPDGTIVVTASGKVDVTATLQAVEELVRAQARG
jgi:hypothetical protein